MARERTLSAHAGSTARTAGIILMSIILWSLTAGHIFGDSPENPTNAKPAKAALLAVPLSFEANQGQADSRVKYLSHGDGYSLFLTSNEVVFTLRTLAGVKAPPSVFRMELLGAERNAQVSGAEKLPGAVNYFIGNDPKKWRSGIGTYGKVKYQSIYPGIDAVFYGNQRQLEYDFVVAPGADPKRISLGLTGAKPNLDADGNVVLKLADGDLALKKPVVYQNVAGEKKTVEASYTVAANKVRFHLGKYDHNQTLVIDPVFTYLTYLGGSSVDYIGGITGVSQTTSPTHALAIDSAGDVYVTGETLSNDFPVANAYQATRNEAGGAYTAFVSALNPTGAGLLYSTYLGGSVTAGGGAGTDLGASIVWDSLENSVYVVGTTNASDFPMTPGAFQKVYSGNFTAFVAKLNNAGQLTKSTFLGAPLTYGLGVATDSQGRAYVVGYTSYNCTPNGSTCPFPTTTHTVIPTPPASFNGYGFVSVFDTNLSTLLYSTLLGDPNAAPAGGGATTSEAFGVTVDPNGNFYVVGVTSSPSLPATAGAFQPTLGVANSIPLAGFAAKFGPVAANGAALTYLTYLEATGVGFGDFPSDVAADSQGNAYVGGYTNSPTFPVTTGAYNTPCPRNGADLCPAAFVTKLNPSGTGLVWSALVEPADFFSSIQLDTQGNVYVAGHNPGNDSFVPVNPVQPGLNNSWGFVAKLDPTGSTLLFASLIQGGFTLRGLAVDAPGSIYVASYTYDTTLPTTPGAFQTALKNPGTGNSYDGYIAKIALNSPVVTLGPSGQVEAFAAESIISIYGVKMASGTAAATTVPLPTSLDGNSVTVTDSAGVARPAPLYFVSPGQINFEIPLGTAAGTATVTIQNQNGTIQSTTISIGGVSPGIFPLNGSGL
ncbi:MAG: SBBP repeat-containing protein, partial [Bryobacteraceae bacterium]